MSLSVELVPSTCWYSNVRSNVSPADWNKCKQYVRERSGNRCEICGGRGSRWAVECHERWSYQHDDGRHVQFLDGLIALCPDCHLVKHIGRAEATGQLDRAVRHLTLVNNWNEQYVTSYLDAVFEIWAERSEHEWELDISWLETIGVHATRGTT